ncbi:MAG: chloride channel protein [Bacteroidetes bacterium]|nr:chloride channel protein [Bacteroidota bacterium]
MKFSGIFTDFLKWRSKHLDDRYFSFILAVVIGILCGLAAILLKNLVAYTSLYVVEGIRMGGLRTLLIILPMAGILLTVLFVDWIIKDNISHGISKILYTIARKDSVLKRHNTYSSMIGSTLTIGFGGSLGLEAPIVLTGASIGSNLGQVFRMSYKMLTLLIGCGAAGALAGIYKAPIAGVIFVIEVLLLDLTISTLVPLLLASVTAAVISSFLMGHEAIFTFHITQDFYIREIPAYLLLGIVTGLIAVYFIRGSIYIEKLLSPIGKYKKITLGGGMLCLLVFLFPSLFGEGFEALKNILDGQGHLVVTSSLIPTGWDAPWILLLLVLTLVAFKVVAMAVTTGSGGIGGTFAPTLFMGGICGYAFFLTYQMLHFSFTPGSHFALSGMAGMMAAVMSAPLTAIFLIAEISGGYALLIPLIITSTASFITIRLFEKHSIYSRHLAQRKELITHDKDQSVLNLMKVADFLETNFQPVQMDDSLGKLVKVVSRSQRNLFPVLDKEENFIGIVTLDDIRHIMFDRDQYAIVFVYSLLSKPTVVVSPETPMDEVVQLFQKHDVYNMPVVSSGKYIGFISRANVFAGYRDKLREFSQD